MATEDTRLTHGDVERIVQLVEDAGFGYVHFEADGLELTLVKQGYVDPGSTPGASQLATTAPPTADVPVAGTSPAAPAPSAPVAAPPAPAPPTESAPEADSTDDEATAADGPDEPGLVRSPMVGIFYHAPDPESPPYVQVGQTVEAGATVGLVEVMKMFTAIRAERGGEVVEVLAGNAEQVDRGQPLIRIATDG